MQRFTYKIGAQGARDRARQFMGNEIARGIVELITNSDAAYTAQRVSQPKQRPIAVVVNAAARYIEVRDRTGGMSPEVVQDKFTEGGATSEAGQRGYFGLGAKDCAAFGSLIVKTINPVFPILGVFRLNGQPKRDGSTIVRFCKASQSPVYPIRDTILAANHGSCPSLSSSGPRQWGESALKTSRLPGALSLLARSWLYPPSAWRRR